MMLSSNNSTNGVENHLNWQGTDSAYPIPSPTGTDPQQYYAVPFAHQQEVQVPLYENAESDSQGTAQEVHLHGQIWVSELPQSRTNSYPSPLNQISPSLRSGYPPSFHSPLPSPAYTRIDPPFTSVVDDFEYGGLHSTVMFEDDSNSSWSGRPQALGGKRGSFEHKWKPTPFGCAAPPQMKYAKTKKCPPSPPDRYYPKPCYSYSCLIAMAMKNCRTGQLPVNEIYKFITTNFPYFKTARDGWKVRKMEEEIIKCRNKDPGLVRQSASMPEILAQLETGGSEQLVEKGYEFSDSPVDDIDKIEKLESDMLLDNNRHVAEELDPNIKRLVPDSLEFDDLNFSTVTGSDAWSKTIAKGLNTSGSLEGLLATDESHLLRVDDCETDGQSHLYRCSPVSVSDHLALILKKSESSIIKREPTQVHDDMPPLIVDSASPLLAADRL